MRDAPSADATEPRWPRLWRIFLIGLGTLILCSCRAPVAQWSDGSAPPPPQYQGMPEDAYTGGPPPDAQMGSPWGPPGMEEGVPLPYATAGGWSPPGIGRPWPQDEYLRDGGDGELPAEVAAQWEVHGLEVEDTIAHYDTLDGQTVVEPTNRVHIYSPRFGSVRKVVGMVAREQVRGPRNVFQPAKLAGPSSTQGVSTSQQDLQANSQIGTKPLAVFQSKQGDGALSSAVKSQGNQGKVLPYEAPNLIRQGLVDSAEMAFIARGAAAAVAWSSDQAVQVILDDQAAMADVSDQAAQAVYTIQGPPPQPKLRIVKVASTQVAEPGDEVALTIRFDNVGNQVIGNVTIIDNLATRLEYVPDSAQCSLKAQFSTQPNEGGSLVVRCEITDPLQPGKGGVVRFRCRVR